jgi:ABC-type amino acid transport substrate-binding protein
LNEINDIDDLVNLRIGYAKGGFLTPLMNNKILKFDLISTSGYHLTNIKRLNLGRIDAVFAPGSLSLIFNIQKLNLGDRIKLLELPDVKTSYYIIFSKI